MFRGKKPHLDMLAPFPKIGHGVVTGLGMAQGVDGNMGPS